MTTTQPLDAVRAWRAEADAARARAGLTAQELPTAVILAIIHVESKGDARARRPGSQYHGLTQVGWAAGLDSGLIEEPPTRTAAWRTSATAVLMGDGAMAIDALLRVIVRYRSRTLYEGIGALDGVAVLWKGGAGTARKVRDALRQGGDLGQTLQREEQTIPSLGEYVRRARAAYLAYDDDDDGGVC